MSYPRSTDLQIDHLRTRGLIITDTGIATRALQHIGYYRLMRYLRPFARPSAKGLRRDNKLIEGTTLEDVLALYRFDERLQSLLIHHLFCIEIALKANLCDVGMQAYGDDYTWFISPKCISQEYICSFRKSTYRALRERDEDIRRHHLRHPGDQYAPVWKTIEAMTFGQVEALYSSLTDEVVRNNIRRRFNVKSNKTFITYLRCCRMLRNIAAHRKSLFCNRPPFPVQLSPAGITRDEQYTLMAYLKVVIYLIGALSESDQRSLIADIQQLTSELLRSHPTIRERLPSWGGIELRKLCSANLFALTHSPQRKELSLQ